MDFSAHSIKCARFGGSRPAFACCTLDRFRTCRKRCLNLAEHLKQYPDLPKKAAMMYRRRQRGKSGELFSMLTMRSAGKGLPHPELHCPWCNFVAKSTRGRAIHLKRKHFGRGL